MISIKSRIIGVAGYYLCRTNFINPVFMVRQVRSRKNDLALLRINNNNNNVSTVVMDWGFVRIPFLLNL